MDQILSNINREKQTISKKESSPLKSKVSMIRRRSFIFEEDLIQTDAVPSIDPSQMNIKDKMKYERMRHRDSRAEWMFYPEDNIKMYWDLYINLILLISCLITPFRIAFGEIEDPIGWTIINFTIDGCFLIDIIIIFNSAFYDEEFMIVEDRRKIAMDYLQSWFVIDLLAIIPFDYFVMANNYGEIVRIARIGRISKLIKMTRLLRILKIVRQRSQLLKYLNELLKIGLGFERLFFFMIIFFILCHIITCLWVLAA